MEPVYSKKENLNSPVSLRLSVLHSTRFRSAAQLSLAYLPAYPPVVRVSLGAAWIALMDM